MASPRAGLCDSKVSELYRQTLIEPKQGLKSIAKTGKKQGYQFDTAELSDALDEMNKGGAFTDIDLDAVALEALFSQGGDQKQPRRRGC